MAGRLRLREWRFPEEQVTEKAGKWVASGREKNCLKEAVAHTLVALEVTPFRCLVVASTVFSYPRRRSTKAFKDDSEVSTYLGFADIPRSTEIPIVNHIIRHRSHSGERG